ncbi:response regulator [Massilia sp. DWR3-1-1]|uniref:response regulator n=1 Tax=Massilia sp. DWR3-1-1 TaxID=2804559 RepID=UPI003CEF6170
MLIPRQLFRHRSDITGWLLTVIAFATLGGSLLAWYSVESERLLAAENDRLSALSKILVEDITVNLVAVDRALAGVIRDRLADDNAFDRVAVTRRLRALVEAMPGVRGIVVMNDAGTVVAAIPEDLTGRDFSQRTYFTVPRQRGDAALLYLSPPFRSIRGDIVMSATRVIPAQLRLSGVVSAVLDPRYFSGILHTALYAPDMRAAIVHSDGAGFVAAGAVAVRPRQGAATLGATARIAPAGVHVDHALTLQLQRDPAVVTAPLNRQAQAFGALYGALALVWAGALGWFQARRRRFQQFEAERKRERLQAEALAASEARFRTLIEEAPVAVAMARHGRFIYTNRRYNLLHGYDDDADLTGLAWGAMIAPASLATLREVLATLDADAAVEQRFEAIALGQGGALIPVFKATSRVLLGDGPATLIFVQDISAQKSAEGHLLEARDAAEAANRSKAEFLANMSHEIRTPLNAILGMAYLLERGNRDVEAASMLQKIRVAGRSLLGIINDILDVSKIEAGAMVIEQRWFALQDVIDTVAATMGVAVADKPITLLVAPLPTVAASVLGDALRLEQLLVNLTSNAIKFTQQGSVSLTVQANLLADGRAELVFRVTDTGIGITEAQQQNIFSAFTQADTSTTRRYGGSGLGLTICKRIVELMQGRIGVDSRAGAGSSFWFAVTLPVRAAANGSSAPEMHELDVLVAAAGTPATSVADTARALGWRVRQADCGAAVLAALGKGARLPGAIMLDWQLPGAGGIATLRAIRAAAPADACPVVILISAYQAGVFEADQDHGLADAMLTTPVTTSTLYNAVLEARRKRAVSEDTLALPARAGTALSGLHLLVVDDSDINRDVARRILECEGARVDLAENGRAAIDWLLAHPETVDLVLMDVQMPVMDGIEATTILRGMAQFAGLPIVALTAGAFSTHQDAARNAGMDHFIAKPFDVATTIGLIRRLTGPHGGAVAMLPAPAGSAI